MNQAFRFSVIVMSGALGLMNRSSAQCFVCSDASQNTAVGTSALGNPSGANNTAIGTEALYSDSSGTGNAAMGYLTLYGNTTGSYNSATGYVALYGNTTGSYNTAMGYEALKTNSVGAYTTAVGAFALQASTTGGYDTGFGAYALFSNTTGSGNSAFGYAGLRSMTSGSDNIGFGYQTLYLNSTGSNNIAMGYQGGYYVLNGSNNIEIGNLGAYADSGLIRIGTPGTQTKAYVAGVLGAQVTGSAVYVTSSGQLGVLGSSERYKTDISTMPEVSARLSRLRPVTFHYKQDSSGALQYGLIAEEVEKVYPELVIRDDAGDIQGVRYEELAPILLGEVQRQQASVENLSAQVEGQAAEIRELRKLVTEMQRGSSMAAAAKPEPSRFSRPTQ
jgi:hypothetical protein